MNKALKKTGAAILSAAMMIGAAGVLPEGTLNGFCIEASADSAADYKIVNGVLVQYNGAGGAITIPKGVTDIGTYVFSGNTSITSVTIPEGCDSIGDYAFEGCTNLRTVAVPSTLTIIDSHAFCQCTSLSAINLPEGINTIGLNAFESCTSLSDITIPSTVSNIGIKAFLRCSGLGSLTVQNGTTTISKSAFDSCTNLKTVKIPSSVTSVGLSAFSQCSSLSDVYYDGTSEQWNSLTASMSSGNDKLKSATVHYSGSVQTPIDSLASIPAQTYTGSALTPALTVKAGSTVLTSGTDYTAVFSGNVNVGTATVTVTGIGSYTGTLNGSFTISPKNLSSCTIDTISDQTYTGSALTPAVTVKDGSKTLTKDVDYTVSYSNNVNVGTATVTVTGKGNYTGTKTATFKINENSATDFTVSAVSDQTYTGTALTPAVTVKDGSKTLVKDTDYTVSYSNNINVGTATVTVTGNGNYAGIVKGVTFKINAKNASSLTISAIADQTYTGSAITPAVTVKDGSKTLVKDTDYTVSYSNNINVGTATVTVTGKGNYTGTKTATFKINAKNASSLTISAIADQTYTGSATTPAVTVKDGSKTLVKDTDYTVSYSNNINVGTATVTITGKGNYTGSKTTTFKIVSNTGIMYGDVTGDKKINAKDVLAIRKYIVKADPGTFILAAADVNDDNKVNAKDVLKIRKYIVDPTSGVLGQA